MAAIEPTLQRPQRPLQLAAARTLEPFAQGGLDYLCGVYAAINAMRLVAAELGAPLSDENSEVLFQHSIAYLHERNKLAGALRYGMRPNAWVRLVRELAAKLSKLIGLPILVIQPFKGDVNVPPAVILDITHEAIRQRQAVPVWLKGSYNHYTVICGVSATRLTLFDSYGYCWIRRDSCSAGSAPARHEIHAPSLLLVGG